MQLVAPDILADVANLSPTVLLVGMGLSLAVWLFGWTWHRFWVVAAVTVLAGLSGLFEGPAFNTPPIVAGLLLAIAAGMLALAIVRLLAFLGGGFAGVIVAQSIAPSFAQPLVVFLVSGMACLILFRPFLMAATSFGGSLLMAYVGLVFAGRYGKFDVVDWAGRSVVQINVAIISLAVVGAAVQYWIDRQFFHDRKKKKKLDDDEIEDILPDLAKLAKRRKAG